MRGSDWAHTHRVGRTRPRRRRRAPGSVVSDRAASPSADREGPLSTGERVPAGSWPSPLS